MIPVNFSEGKNEYIYFIDGKILLALHTFYVSKLNVFSDF